MQFTSRLTQSFAAALTLGLVHFTAAAAQEPSPPSGPILEQDNNPASPAAGQTATPAPAYSFKPLAFCNELESRISEEAKRIAETRDSFAAVEQWSDRADAAQIMGYRMCRDDITNHNDSLFSDVLWRVNEKEWFAALVLPFAQQDPVFLWRLSRSGNWRDNFPFAIQYPGAPAPNDGRPVVAVTLESLRALAADRQRASSLLSNIRYFKNMPEAESLARIAIATDPISLLTSYSLADDFPNLRVDNIGSGLLEEARKGRHSSTFLRSFDQYAHLPEAQAIAQAAVDSNPLEYMYIKREGRLSSRLTEDGYVQVHAARLMDLAHNLQSASDVIGNYEAYRHLPEAREIVQAAIHTDSLSFIQFKERGNLHPLLAGDNTLTLSAASLLAAAERDWSSTLIGHYDQYAHLPEARVIITKAIASNPTSYFDFRRRNELPPAVRGPEFMPTIADLRRMLEPSRGNYDAMKLLSYYDVYKHLPGAREFAQAVADKFPLSYFDSLDDNFVRIPDSLAKDRTFMPSAESLSRVAEDSGKELLRHYRHYAHLPEALTLLQTAIRFSPVEYYSFISDKYNKDSSAPILKLVAAGKIAEPTAADLFAYVKRERHYGTNDLLGYFRQFSDMPEALEIVNAAIDANPWQMLDRALQMISGPPIGSDPIFGYVGDYRPSIKRGPHWPLPDEEWERDLLRHVFDRLYHNHRREINKKFEASDYGFNKLLAMAGADENLLAYALEIGRKRPMAVLNAFAHPDNRILIDRMSRDWQQKFTEVLKPVIPKLCEPNTYSRDGFSLLYAGSWVTEGGVISEGEIAKIIACLAKKDIRTTVEVLEKNDNLLRDAGRREEVVRTLLKADPLYFLMQATHDEKAAGLTIARVNLSYADLLKASREYIAVEWPVAKNAYSVEWNIIKVLNNLHDCPAETRFALLEKVPRGYYLDLVTNRVDSYYTSTFNRLFDGFMQELKTNPETRQRLWEDDWQGRETMRTLLNNSMQFGRLDEFLQELTADEIRKAASKILDYLQREDNHYRDSTESVLMTTSTEIFRYMAALGHARDIEKMLVERFTNERRTEVRMGLGLVAALYSRTAESATYGDFFEKVLEIYQPHMQRYMRTDLRADTLFDARGRNFQMMVFYNDRDGQSTFGHFRNLYAADKRWRYRDHGKFISFTRNGVQLFANKPQFEKEGNEAIAAHVAEQGGTLSVLVHRGHSYHVGETAKAYLDKNVRFFWLGSCRSGAVWEHIDDAPDMQFIYSENVGTMLVNDPLLKNINDTLAARQDVNWLKMREDALRLSQGDKRVNDYIFPDGSLEYAIRMTRALFRGDYKLAEATQEALLDAIYSNATQGNKPPDSLQIPPNGSPPRPQF